MSDQQDRIYATTHQQVARFSFDDTVVRVFPDMIRRSVPGYASIIDMIGVLAARYAQPDTCLYDLGCSLGAAATAMASAQLSTKVSGMMLLRPRCRNRPNRFTPTRVDMGEPPPGP